MYRYITSVLFLVTASSSAMKSHVVFWNSSSPMFRVDNTDHIIDVNHGNLPGQYDQVNIVCPFSTEEKLVIYSVSREDFEDCRVSNPKPTIIAVCDRPQSFTYFTITFRSFSPIPGGLEFKPGQDVYFISTSNVENIHTQDGGYCLYKNMKMIFKVAASRDEANTINDDLNSLDENEARKLHLSSEIPGHIKDYDNYYKLREMFRNQLEKHPYNHYRKMYKQFKQKEISALPLTSASGVECYPALVSVIFPVFMAVILM